MNELSPPGGGVLGLIFPRYLLLVSQSPYPIKAYSVANFIIDSILVPFRKCNFCDPNFKSHLLFMHLPYFK